MAMRSGSKANSSVVRWRPLSRGGEASVHAGRGEDWLCVSRAVNRGFESVTMQPVRSALFHCQSDGK